MSCSSGEGAYCLSHFDLHLAACLLVHAVKVVEYGDVELQVIGCMEGCRNCPVVTDAWRRRAVYEEVDVRAGVCRGGLFRRMFGNDPADAEFQLSMVHKP